MTACESALEAMSERMDEALAAPQRAALREHLSSCASCRAREAGISELRDLLRRLVDVSTLPPELVARRVRAAVTGEAVEDVPMPASRPAVRGQRSSIIPALIGTTCGLLFAVPVAFFVFRAGARHVSPVAPAPGVVPVAAVPVTPSLPIRHRREPATNVPETPVAEDPGNSAPPAISGPPMDMPPPPDPSETPAEPASVSPDPLVSDPPPNPIRPPGPLAGNADVLEKFSGRVLIVTTSRTFAEDVKKVFESLPGKVRIAYEDLPGNHRFQMGVWFSGPDARDMKGFYEKWKKFQEAHSDDFESMDWKTD